MESIKLGASLSGPLDPLEKTCIPNQLQDLVECSEGQQKGRMEEPGAHSMHRRLLRNHTSRGREVAISVNLDLNIGRVGDLCGCIFSMDAVNSLVSLDTFHP